MVISSRTTFLNRMKISKNFISLLSLYAFTSLLLFSNLFSNNKVNDLEVLKNNELEIRTIKLLKNFDFFFSFNSGIGFNYHEKSFNRLKSWQNNLLLELKKNTISNALRDYQKNENKATWPFFIGINLRIFKEKWGFEIGYESIQFLNNKVSISGKEDEKSESNENKDLFYDLHYVRQASINSQVFKIAPLFRLSPIKELEHFFYIVSGMGYSFYNSTLNIEKQGKLQLNELEKESLSVTNHLIYSTLELMFVQSLFFQSIGLKINIGEIGSFNNTFVDKVITHHLPLLFFKIGFTF